MGIIYLWPVPAPTALTGIVAASGGGQSNDMVYRPLRYEQMMKAAEGLDVRARRMANGMGVYTGEKMFAFLVGEDIGLKLAPADFEEAMRLDGAEPLRTEPSAEPMREYVRMPRSVLDNYESFVFWVQRSANYARSKCVH